MMAVLLGLSLSLSYMSPVSAEVGVETLRDGVIKQQAIREALRQMNPQAAPGSAIPDDLGRTEGPSLEEVYEKVRRWCDAGTPRDLTRAIVCAGNPGLDEAIVRQLHLGMQYVR